jgi:hypothetical protein
MGRVCIERAQIDRVHVARDRGADERHAPARVDGEALETEAGEAQRNGRDHAQLLGVDHVDRGLGERGAARLAIGRSRVVLDEA